MKDKDKKKVIGAAAGAAAAAAVGVGVAAAMKGGKPSVYHVRQRDEGWAVEQEGAKQASSRHGTKRQAVKAGRELAGGKTPSRLVIHRTDGSVQKEHAYEKES